MDWKAVSCLVWKLVHFNAMPMAETSPRRLAALRRAQRDSGQLLFDHMGQLEETTMGQRKRLQQRLLEVVAKLQYRGESSEVRGEIADELKKLASAESHILPVPPSLAEGIVLAEVGSPQKRPSTVPAASPGRQLQHLKHTQASSRSEARSPTRGGE